MLEGKHIILGITGGIAAYKAPELIRLLRKKGAEVRVCCTQHALEFVTPLVLETLSNNAVYSDTFAPHNAHETEHIAIAEWADMLIVAPCTANLLGKIAHGIADDALSTTALAIRRPVLIVPAMNEGMLENPAVKRNIDLVRSFGHIRVMDCTEGFLACGSAGKGRMQEPETIVEEADAMLERQTLAGKRVLITAGPTVEPIDPVRFISNHSSGKMGYAIARLCCKRGAEVTIVSGPTACTCSKAKVVPVKTAAEMYEATTERFEKADITILCAAVADFAPIAVSPVKIKQKDGITITTAPTKDIAATLGQKKQAGQLLVGFALETDHEEANALGKMQKKNLDLIVLNSLQDAGAGFGHDTNKVTVYSREGKVHAFPLESKEEAARDIIDCIERL